MHKKRRLVVLVDVSTRRVRTTTTQPHEFRLYARAYFTRLNAVVDSKKCAKEKKVCIRTKAQKRDDKKEEKKESGFRSHLVLLISRKRIYSQIQSRRYRSKSVFINIFCCSTPFVRAPCAAARQRPRRYNIHLIIFNARRRRRCLREPKISPRTI